MNLPKRAVGALAPLLLSTALRAEAPTPPITLTARDTIETWRDVTGGQATSGATLNKLQLSATLNGEAYGVRGLRLHVQIFRADGESLSALSGDIQTLSNIEAPPATRLFEAWIEQAIGEKDHGASLRVGLIDLNSEFDSIDPASLFIDSSHGIGPDLSRSGRNGPSIFPVSALAVRAEWVPSPRWVIRVGAFDGVPGEPDHPKAFAAVRLHREDGALLIAETDYKPAKDIKLAIGAWEYTEKLPSLGYPISDRSRDHGYYASIAAPLPRLEHWSLWLRAGRGAGEVQTVHGYLGAGVVAKGLVAARKEDRFGISISRAAISPAARAIEALPRTETIVEASYQARFGEMVALQPDIQYVVHPASVPGLRNALVFGLRLVITANYPKVAPTDAVADPTAAPDAPGSS